MHSLSIAIVGASGYSGLELTRIAARHPHLRVAALFSDRWNGEPVGGRVSVDGKTASLRYLPLSEAGDAKAQVAFLATPAEASLALAPKLLARGLKVVDLSGAFRLEDPAAYPLWYGFEHTATDLLATARYGLPELARASLAGATLVTNPGCYATAIALVLAPILKAGLASPAGIAVSAMSGVSGAGRKASDDFSFCEIDEDLRAYRIGRHQHTPEIEQTVARYAGACESLCFVPHLVPMRRGILATCLLRPAKGATHEDAEGALRKAYEGERFVKVFAADRVSVKDVARTNRAHVGVTFDARAGVLVAISAIDNLVKGAAGQAVQALNAAMEWDEAKGLDLLGG
jgi:N-acetyl-gamma-glutamyl-phosphate reductase